MSITKYFKMSGDRCFPSGFKWKFVGKKKKRGFLKKRETTFRKVGILMFYDHMELLGSTDSSVHKKICYRWEQYYWAQNGNDSAI